MDISNFYLNTPLDKYEYMRLRLDIIPQEIIDAYNLTDLMHDGWIYIEIRKGMYGLPQAGILANKLLRKRLATKGYYHCQHTPGLWRHVWRPITFCLVVDDFGIKSTNNAHVLHLKDALEENYCVTVDWTGSLFIGITLTWDYINRFVDLHMPLYINKAVLKYQHPKPDHPQHSPNKHAPTSTDSSILII